MLKYDLKLRELAGRLKVQKIIIGDIEYDLSNATNDVKSQLANIEFVDGVILERNNELQIAETAKIGYSRALKRELDKIGQDAED